MIDIYVAVGFLAGCIVGQLIYIYRTTKKAGKNEHQ